MVRYGKKWLAGIAAAVTVGGLSMGIAPLAHAAPTIGANANAYGTGSTAAWNAAGTAVTLDPSNASGASAQVDLIKPPAPTAAEAPTLTASSASAGDPRWVIEFHNGDYLFGQLPNGTTAQSTLTWSLEPAGTAQPSWSAALAAADAGGADNSVTAAFIVDDAGYAGTAVDVSSITYNGEAVVPYVKPGPPTPPAPPAPRPYLYGGHVITVNNNDAEVGWNDGPGVHYVLTRTFGYGFSPNGSPHLGFTGITTGYWSGLAAGHTYDIEFIPADANRHPLPNARVGWINVVTTR
ncbi:MAG TPA: hypothetical protein VHV09_24030 [Trebonia sp.]|nr:hypothetical protein [Trebonia sp.]